VFVDGVALHDEGIFARGGVKLPAFLTVACALRREIGTEVCRTFLSYSVMVFAISYVSLVAFAT